MRYGRKKKAYLHLSQARQIIQIAKAPKRGSMVEYPKASAEK